MSLEAQRIAIAKVMGWKWVRDGFGTWRIYPESQWQKFKPEWMADNSTPTSEDIEDGYGVNGIPDYLNDLNACAEFENSLERYDKYCVRLHEIVWRDCGGENPRYESATAAQRAEAFLRTLNLWEVEA